MPATPTTVRGFECLNCSAIFTDGILAGQHETDTAHRVEHANLDRALLAAEQGRDTSRAAARLPAVSADIVVILDELEREWFDRFQGELIPADQEEGELGNLALHLWSAATWAPHDRRTIAEATTVVIDALAAILAVGDDEPDPDKLQGDQPFTILRYTGMGREVAGMSSGVDKADALARFKHDACGGLGTLELFADDSGALHYAGDTFIAEEGPR